MRPKPLAALCTTKRDHGGCGFVKRRARNRAVAVALASLTLVLATGVAFAAAGALTQPAGNAGCVSEDGAGPCADGHGLGGGVDAAAVSPDGRSVYATTHSTVARFKRNRVTGAITQPSGKAGCVSEDGSGPCADGHGISTSGADSVAVSPDGKTVYVASYTANAVIRFKRNRTTGAIKEPAGKAGCVSEDGSGPCADGHGLSGVAWVAVSANGKSVYAASTISNAVVRFKRNRTTGAIKEPAGRAGCVSEDGSGPCADGHALLDVVWVAPSFDGKSLYVASLQSNAVVRFKRNRTTGAIKEPAGKAGCLSEDGSGPCTDGHGLAGPFSVAVSDDGKSVYAASADSNAVVRFKRNRATGAIKEPDGKAGCVSEDGSGPCADGHGLSGANGVAVSSDGKNVYVTSDNAVARLNRKRATGAINQPAGAAGCVSEDGSGPCADGRALAGTFGLAVSRDGKSVYTVSLDDAAVARFKRAR
jgi:sugar lactone lactonase YvrE